MAETVAGVVLAGGGSRRMGTDKALLDVGGRPLLAHVAARLAPQVGALALNANGNPARFADFDLPVIADGGYAGPLAGILTAMRWAAQANADHVVSLPVDTPFVPADLAARLLAALGTAEIAIARSRGRTHPTVGLWRTSLGGDLDTWLAGTDDLAVRAFLAGRQVAMADFPDDAGGDPFFNVNTPEDAAIASARLAGR